MTIAARLNGDPGTRLVPEIFGHHGCGTAQERERTLQHALVTNGNKLAHAVAVSRREDRYRIAIGGAAKIGVLLAGGLPPQTFAVPVALSGCIQCFPVFRRRFRCMAIRLHDEGPVTRECVPAPAIRQDARRAVPPAQHRPSHGPLACHTLVVIDTVQNSAADRRNAGGGIFLPGDWLSMPSTAGMAGGTPPVGPSGHSRWRASVKGCGLPAWFLGGPLPGRACGG